MPEILFVVTLDSQFKWAAAAAAPFRRAGWQIRYFAPSERTKISEAQITDAGVAPEEVIRGRLRTATPRLAAADAVIFVTQGGITEVGIYRLRDHIAQQGTTDRRPVIASAYVGMVIDNHVMGYLFRAAGDFVCVNSRHDLAVFDAARADLGIPPDNLELTGLAILGGLVPTPREGPIRQVVFADQVGIPEALPARKWIYQGLLEYALRHPSRRVIVKPRHRPGESVFHAAILTPEDFFSARRPVPENLIIDYTPISALLPQTDLLLTISSTAALEAIAHGVRTAIIADVGVEERHGNTLFLGSGLIRTFAQIAEDRIGQPDPAWTARFQHEGPDPAEAIFAAVTRRAQAIRDGRLALPETPYFTARRRVREDLYGFNSKPAPPARKTSAKGQAKSPAKRTPAKPPVARSRLRRLGRAMLPQALVLPLYRFARQIGAL